MIQREFAHGELPLLLFSDDYATDFATEELIWYDREEDYLRHAQQLASVHDTASLQTS